MIYKKHTRNQKRMYRIHKMEEQIEKDKYIIGKQEQELDKYKNIVDEATKELEKLLPLCIMPNNTLIHATEKSKVIEETIKILKGE